MEGKYFQEGFSESVFSNISGFCYHLSSGISDAERKEYIFRELRKLAYSYLLKKKISVLKSNDTNPKDVPLELFMCIAHRRSQLGEWESKDFAEAATLMERYEALATNNQYSWLLWTGKMLLALENHLSAMNSSPPEELGISNLTCTVDAPNTIHSSKQNLCYPDLFDLNGCDSLMCRVVETHLQQMRDPQSLRWPPNFAGRVANMRWSTEVKRRKDAASVLRLPESRSNSSSPFTDEGFSSPSRQEQAPIDWSLISSVSINPRREWDNIGDYNPFDESIFENPKKIRRLRKSFQLSPCNLVKVDQVQLIVNVKALLTGIASDIFPLVGHQFSMKPGLYTDSKPPIVLFSICKPLRRAGEIFACLNKQKDCYPCSTSAAMDCVIKHYLIDYQAMVLSIPDDSCISKLMYGILPFIDQLEYLYKLQQEVLQRASHGCNDANAYHGWRLLQKLFNDFLRNGNPDLDKLISGIFLDCCQVYFGFIDEWIFEGKWHPDLFFQQTMADENVVDRYSWIKMFSFSPNNCPAFLPAKNIFECGRMVHLVKNMFMIDGSYFSRECRPRATLVTNRAMLHSVKYTCQFYAHTGEDFRSAVRRVFINNSSEDLLRAAVEKASANSSKFIEAKNAERELKISIRRKNLDIIKEELKRYQQHQNIEKLKLNIHELMQHDEIMLSQLREVIGNSSLRYELIERYVKELDRIMKRTLLNTWKDRRYAYTAIREKYFADLEKALLTPEYIPQKYAEPHYDSCDDASKADLAQSTFIPNYCAREIDFDSPSPLNEDISTPKDVEPTENSLNEQAVSHLSTCEQHSHSRGHQKTKTVSSDLQINVVPTPEEVNALLPDQNISGYLEIAESDEGNCVNESENPPACCEGAAFNDSTQSRSTLSSDSYLNSSNEIIDSFDRIMFDYERRVKNDTLKPFAHILKFKKRKSKPSVEETLDASVISPAEFSKSFVSYHMKKSISYPLEAQNKVLNNLILHKFFVENEFLTHLKRLRDIFFRNDGVSALVLTKLICCKIERERPETFLVYPTLQNILNLSFQTDSDFISLKAEIAAPSAFDFTDPNVINCLRITYATDWPLKLILTEKAIAKYNDVFLFLFSIDRTLWHVQEAAQRLKIFSVDFREPFKQLHLHLHVMLVILNAVKLYTGFCVTNCWEKFHNLLENVKCPETLYRVHVNYIKNIIYKFMLVKQMSRVHEGLTKVLHYVLVYCQTLKLCDWHMFTTDQQYLSVKIKKLSLTFENFRIMVDGTCSVLDYYIKQRGHEHLKMLHQSIKLPSGNV